MADEAPLFKIKGDLKGSAELTVGSRVPGLIKRVFPTLATRLEAREALGARIVQKIRDGAVLDDDELLFAESVLDEHVLKSIRLRRITERGIQLTLERTLLEHNGDSSGPPNDVTEGDFAMEETSSDWVNKFREDAGLVDDEMLREVYARVLSEESLRPNSIRLRTLGVLRYLDGCTASAFGRLQLVRLWGNDEISFIPSENTARELLNSIGLNHIARVQLADAGLLNNPVSELSPPGLTELAMRVPAHGRIIRLHAEDGKELRVNLAICLLTPAGQQLSVVAQVDPDPGTFLEILRWLRRSVGNVGRVVVGECDPRRLSVPVRWAEWTDS